MKKLFFSFVMLVTLVIVAGSAKGQTGITPYPGGTYTYTLGGIKINTAGKVKIEYSGGVAGTKIQNFVGLTGTDLNALDIAATVTEIKFDIAYDLAESAGPRTIKVTITEGTCSNFISKTVTIQNKPALALSIDEPQGSFCQARVTNPDDNVAATVPTSSQNLVNTIKFTVTPTLTNVTTAYNYEYILTLPDAITTKLQSYTIVKTAGGGTYSNGKVTKTGTTGSDTSADEFTITFVTTTGLANVEITGALSDSKLTVTAGNGVYVGTYGVQSDKVTVNSMPSIGSFTWNP